MLSTDPNLLKSGDIVSIAGFGINSADRLAMFAGGRLFSGEIKIIEPKQPPRIIDAIQIGDTPKGSATPGDSGGALFKTIGRANVLAGVTSHFGLTLDSGLTADNHFVNVAYFKDWIEEVSSGREVSFSKCEFTQITTRASSK